MNKITVEHGNRTDPLRPSAFDPSEVTVVDFIDTDPPRFPRRFWDLRDGGKIISANTFSALFAEEEEEYRAQVVAWEEVNIRYFGTREPKRQCDHCGAHIRWAFVIKYLPTGQHFVVGAICGTERMPLPNREAFDVHLAQKRAESRKARIEIIVARALWAKENPEAAEALAAYDGDNSFLGDLKDKLRQYGSLSPNQTQWITKVIAREAEKAEKAANGEAEVVGPAITEGRYEVTGEVVGLKWQEDYYGASTLKIMVKSDDGNKFWVTAPVALQEQVAFGPDSDEEGVRGYTVTLKASWTPSQTDEHFAFGKRPVLVSAERKAS